MRVTADRGAWLKSRAFPLAFRVIGIAGLIALALMAQPAAAQRQQGWRDQEPMTESDYPPAPDYALAADWACRPDHEAPCISGLDAVQLGRDGSKTPHPFTPAGNPAIDCFYVYPTASREQQPYADPTPEPAVMEAVREEAGRLASKCRLFAPLYRQATLRHLIERTGEKWDGPYQDIAAAWDWYLAHDNQGRGVVLIGHSQGAIMLQKLISERIDGSPAQTRLVSAFLIGDRGFKVPSDRTTGATFQHIPVCTTIGETGCAYSWSSYLADDDAERSFGLDTDGGDAVCTNPVSAAADGTLDAYFDGKSFPSAGSAPFVEISGQIEAACRRDAQGSVLRITVLPGPNADAIRAALDGAAIRRPRKDWGLHRLDVALTQGNILQLLDAQTATWLRDHR